ncbi:hypothetical protein AB0N88_25775 [Streptomyces sp. NPDC093516]|uniref:ATP-dependent DNA ligase n=1 Tax=Streptomyces sp. NPDC093516 TaxID=3155304 RepID=UPI00342379B0
MQQRLARRSKGASQAAGQWPAHYVAFDLLHQSESNLTGWPYWQRRAALDALFANHRLQAPLTSCPSTSDPDVTRGWLEWTKAGLEGLCFKRLNEPYQAADQVRITGAWVRGDAGRQVVVVLVHAVTAPRRAPARA